MTGVLKEEQRDTVNAGEGGTWRRSGRCQQRCDGAKEHVGLAAEAGRKGSVVPWWVQREQDLTNPSISDF